MKNSINKRLSKVEQVRNINSSYRISGGNTHPPTTILHSNMAV